MSKVHMMRFPLKQSQNWMLWHHDLWLMTLQPVL